MNPNQRLKAVCDPSVRLLTAVTISEIGGRKVVVFEGRCCEATLVMSVTIRQRIASACKRWLH
jgi:hypothetical protein